MTALPPVFEQKFTLANTFSLLPAGTIGTIEWIDNPDLAKAIEPCIKVVMIEASGSSPLQRTAPGKIRCEISPPPVDLAFVVFTRSRMGVETLIGRVAMPAGQAHPAIVFFPHQSITEGTDLIFRSDEGVAKATVDIHQAWWGEIVLKSLSLQKW